MRGTPRLETMLATFQRGVVAPHEGARVPRADRFIVPSPTLAPMERLRIYQDMYFARLVEALATDYPALRQLLGEHRFRNLCRDYLKRHPSRSWTLNVLGRRLPEFARGRIPGVAAAVATLEGAMSESFDAEERTPLTAAEFRQVPAAQLEHARLQVSPSLRLLTLDWSVNELLSRQRQGRPLAPAPRRRCWIGVVRRDYRVWRLDLEEAEHVLLGTLAEGRPLSSAIRRATRCWRGGVARLARSLHRWLNRAVAAGCFTRIVGLETATP